MISKMAASVKSDTGMAEETMAGLRGGWQAIKKLLRVRRTMSTRAFS